MSKILVVDDRSTNRQLLVTLLGYSGHTLLEATNGVEALNLTQAEHPDLIITDILMPMMDGFEFVQALRGDAAIAATKVIFYTATYLVQEADSLAAACGVEYVISKPAEPQTILDTVNKALGIAPSDSVSLVDPALAIVLPPLPGEISPTPLSQLGNKLTVYLNDLSSVNQQLAELSSRGAELAAQREQITHIVQKFGADLASVQTISLRLSSLIELAADLILERDSQRVLDILCHAAGKIVSAPYTAIGMLAEDQQSLRYFVTHGLDAATISKIGLPALDGGLMGRLMAERRPLRLHEEIILHTNFPPIHSFLGMPILSQDHVLGFLYFVDSPNPAGFSPEDEWLATTLAAEIALLYENTQLYDQIQRHATKLQLEVAERRRIEEQLRQSNKTLQTLLEAAPLAIQTLDVDGKVQFWNSAAESMFGFARSEVIGRFLPIGSTEDQERFEKLSEDTFQGNRLLDVEIRPIQKSGAQIDASVSSAPLYDAQGNFYGSISMFVDISERKQHERERESILALAAELRTSVSRAQMVPVILDHLIALLNVTGAALAIRDPLTGETVIELGRGGFAPLTGMRLAAGEGITGSVISSGQLFITDNILAEPKLIHGERLSKPFAAACSPLIVANGETIGVLSIGREGAIRADEARVLTTISDMVASALYRLVLYEQTQAQAQELQQVMDTVTEGLIVIDQGQAILSVNRAAAVYFARLTPVQVGERLTHLGQRSLESLLASPPAGQLYHEVVVDLPTPQLFEVTATPMRTDSEIEAWVLVLRDVTDERKTQKRALQQDRLAAVGELAAGIAHDFNNILTPILLYTDMTANRMAPESQSWSNLQQVLRATQRAKNLVAQILAFSRETTQQRKPIEIQWVIQEVLKLMRAVLPATVEMRQELDPRPRIILADATQIHQVLMNLCTNAYHAMREQGGVLTIVLDTLWIDGALAIQHGNLSAGEYVRLIVSDTGYGMEQATIERIFDPFFTTKAVGEGTGMGLSVVYGIISESGGSISVASQLGEGSAFQIYLPLVDSHVESEEKMDSGPFIGTEHILIIDDEEAIVLVTKEILQSLGYQVTAQSNSVDAVAIFRNSPEQFDLIITDLTMPRLTGIEVAKEMLQIRPDLPILLISGTGEMLTPAMVRSFGFRTNLAKPFTPNEISLAIRHLLDEE